MVSEITPFKKVFLRKGAILSPKLGVNLLEPFPLLPPPMSVDFKLHFTQASSSSQSWLSKQTQLVGSSKVVVASLSCAELGHLSPS